jgi:hypothetical protein
MDHSKFEIQEFFILLLADKWKRKHQNANLCKTGVINYQGEVKEMYASEL